MLNKVAWKHPWITICPMSEVRTFFETRLAVGRFGLSTGKASVRPMKTAIGKMSAKSIYKNWKSPRLDAKAYSKLTVVNWMMLYRAMYLKQLKLVTNAARPSL